MKELSLQKIFLFTFVLSVFSLAETMQIDYKASFGIFGTVGTLKTQLTQEDDKYEIVASINLSGIAKMLLSGHTEKHISKGHIVKGIMISDSYEMIQKEKGKLTRKRYYINHQSKAVLKTTKKWKNGKLVQNKKERLKFYAKDDLLTLYFNLGKNVQKKGETYTFKAVGLEKQEGKVNISIANKEQESYYIQYLGAGAALYAKAFIYQKNFRKKKGNIFISFAKDGFIENTVIKDILLYGDAKIARSKK